MLIVALFMARRLAVPLSESAVLIYSLMRVIPIIGQITGQKTTIDNFFPSYEQVNNLRNRAKECKQKTGTRPFAGFNNAIKIDELSFSYDGRKTVFNNVNVTIPKGKIIAFVGESGAGESTLIDAIIGFN